MWSEKRLCISRSAALCCVLLCPLFLAVSTICANDTYAQEGPQSWGEDWDGDGKDDHFFTDSDRDGNPEIMWVDHDEDGTKDEGWSDPVDDGDWDSQIINDGDNKRENGKTDWDRMKVDGDNDGDFDFVVTDSDDDGDLKDETPTNLNPNEPIPPNRPREPQDQRQGCIGPGCPSPSELGACAVGSGSCLDGTDGVLCSMLGTYHGDGTLCSSSTATIPAWNPVGLIVLGGVLLLVGGRSLAGRNVPATGNRT